MTEDSTEYRAVRFRLHPGTRAKHDQLTQIAGACRFVWNRILADSRRDYAMWRFARDSYGDAHVHVARPSVTFQSLGLRFTRLRRETPWLQELPFNPIRYALKYQADAWRRAFAHGGFPRFKARRGDDSFTIPERVRIDGDRLHIPKVGWVALSRRGGNPYAGDRAVRVVVKREIGKWYAVAVYETTVVRRDNDRTVGVDMNVGQVATSDGDFYRMPDTARLEARKRRYQRMVARRQRGSNRRAVARARLAKTTRKIANVRHAWHHAVSRSIADAAGTVVVENLKVRAMTRSAKGTVDEPGRNVRQKAGLNRSILNTGWAQLRRMIDYKAANLVAVAPRYTSQTCRACGTVDPASRRSQSEFECAHCGHEANADTNAALNILASVTDAAGRGGCTVGWPAKRQDASDWKAA